MATSPPTSKASTAQLRLTAAAPVSREDLEEDTIRVEEVLAARADEHVLGAAAYADFKDNSIEVQFEVIHNTPAELRHKIDQAWEAIEDVVRVESDAATNTTTAPVASAGLCSA